MKKSILLSFLLAVAFTGYSQFRVGIGANYATELSNAGITLGAVYEITENWGAAAGYNHVFTKNYAKWNIFDLEGQYLHGASDKIFVYGLAGLGLVNTKIDVPNWGSSSETSAGFNLGAGALFGITESFFLVPEVKVTIMNGSFVRLGAGVQYKF